VIVHEDRSVTCRKPNCRVACISEHDGGPLFIRHVSRRLRQPFRGCYESWTTPPDRHWRGGTTPRREESRWKASLLPILGAVSPGPSATVIVVARDRWSQAPLTLKTLLARTDPRHRVVVVNGGAPPKVASHLNRMAASGLVQVVRHSRFLASNEARNVGADGATTEWLAFVENDVTLSGGWLDELVSVGEQLGAATTYPAYLLKANHGLIVHGLGADLEMRGPEGARVVRERQHDLDRPWSDVSYRDPVQRVQAEPHTIVIRREFVDRLGGFDEQLLSWFDHTDLALRHSQTGASAYLVPSVSCVYHRPPPISYEDWFTFVLRWGVDWFERSLNHLCRIWGLDRHDSEWDKHAGYRKEVRRCVPTPSRAVNAVTQRTASPVERWLARRWHLERAGS
jgi:GT2 family glycosyltransferase